MRWEHAILMSGRILACSACIVWWLLGARAGQAEAQARVPLRLTRYLNAKQSEVISEERAAPARLSQGQRLGSWTFITGLATEPPCAVFEDVEHRDGRILFVDARGIRLDLGKTSEASAAEPKSLYLGHSTQALQASPVDILGAEILARHGADDPEYTEIASVFAPIVKLRSDATAFVGTPETSEKVAFGYGGRTPNFDPALFSPSVEGVRNAGGVRHGLVGGWLPVLRFVYPDTPRSYTELLAFAPRRTVNGNPRHQPVWYRVSRVEQGVLRFMRYVDSYPVSAPHAGPDPSAFYRDLLQLKAAWDDTLQGSMRLELPDARLADMARYSQVRAIMTRVEDYPKYGVFERDYGGSEHDGFQDTFTVETTAMAQWGLAARAGHYIDNYFGRFVKDDGAVLYRGDEIGQYGRMAIEVRY